MSVFPAGSGLSPGVTSAIESQKRDGMGRNGSVTKIWDKVKGIWDPKSAQDFINDWLAGIKSPEVDTNIKADASLFALVGAALLALWFILTRRKRKEKKVRRKDFMKAYKKYGAFSKG